jgi:hypothetical protein
MEQRMTQAIITGSLKDVSRNTGKPLAESFMDVDAMIVVDVSASMMEEDATGNRKRYDVACSELARLQEELPGKIGVVAFSDRAQFCPNGKPYFMARNTDMEAALTFVKPVDGCGVRLILISDGEPTSDPDETLKLAGKFTTKIDTIYIGPEMGVGRDFLRRLSEATGGISVTQETSKLNLLSQNMKLLLQA